jgi:CBS domain-containing protein
MKTANITSYSGTQGKSALENWAKGINARKIMTLGPLTITLEQTVEDVLELFAENNIRHLPVVRNGELIGMISDRDVKEASCASTMEIIDNPEQAKLRLETPVSSLYRSDFVAVEPDTELSEILDILLEEKVGAVPVVEPRSLQLLGIVSYVDVLRELRDSIQ